MMKAAAAAATKPTMADRYVASMLLHAVGDAMGYRNGKWEFKFSGEDIHKEAEQMGGVAKLKLNPINWKLSDDTILHLAVAECLIEAGDAKPGQQTWLTLIDHYKNAMTDMNGRAPGSTTRNSVHLLSKQKPNGHQVPFNTRGGGCGASMRSSCIGLRYSKPEQKQDLTAFAIESGRMTHHHPIGYLGALAAALFTSYAVQEHAITSWGARFLADLPLAEEYVKTTEHCTKSNLLAWEQVVTPWKNYLKVRKIETGEEEEASFPEKYGVNERDEFYKTIMYDSSGWAGSNGIDSVLIAYDGLLGCKGDWVELCLRAVLHGGDNDSTGCIAGSWFGALYGLGNVPVDNYKNLEYLDRIRNAGKALHDIQYKNS